MSFLRKALVEVGQFDERFRFGGEDLDLCMRMRLVFPGWRLAFVPKARVTHHFDPSLKDALRRSRAYGRGSARLYRKWPAMPPTLFPAPLLVLVMLALSRRRRPLALAVLAAAPQLLYPKGARRVISSRSGASLGDAYVQLAQEACEDIGFLEGLWFFRRLVPEAEAQSVRAASPRERAGPVP